MALAANVDDGTTGILRVASTYNRLATIGASITSRSALAGRSRKKIGSGDLRKMALSFSNFFLNTTAIRLPGNSVTVTAAVCEIATGTTIPLAFGGASSLTMASGAIDQQADPVLPAAFGRSRFTRGDDYEVRWMASIPANGTFCLVGALPVPGLEEARNFDPAATTLTNLNGSGALAFTGTAPTSTRGISVIMLGEFETGDPVVRGGIGDSILEFRDDTITNLQTGSPNGLFTAFFDRALYDDVSTLANPIAAINFGKSGALVGLWLTGGAYLNPYLKYCNQFVEEFGTNTFTQMAQNTANLVTAAIADQRNLWTQIRANAAVSGGRAVKILRTKLLCRTTGAWSAADGSDQTLYGASWGAGGDVELFNAAMLAEVGIAGRVDAYASFDNVVRLGSNGTPEFYKWKQNGPSDGIHPASNLHEGMAGVLRPALRAMAA